VKVHFAVAALLAISTGNALAEQRELIPTSYEAGHFFATPEKEGGGSLRLIVDTGGPGGSGLYVLGSKAVSRLGLRSSSCDLGGETDILVGRFSFAHGKRLPVVDRTPCGAVAFTQDRYQAIADEDGSLGAGYLPHFRWTFDYPRMQLWLEPGDWKAGPDLHQAKLGFVRNQRGEKGTGMPRISLMVDGQTLDMLLDTGATAYPTAAGGSAQRLRVEHGIGVTSYVTSSVIDRWHKKHPTWRIVEDGDEYGNLKSRIIEVPHVQIAGWMIGPVWFTERPDVNYSDADGGMSSYTDKPVVGSAGANILGYFVMTLDYPDYPEDTVWFGCAVACATASK
jgi:hypothetical protein